MELFFTAKFRKDYRKLPKEIQQRVDKTIDLLLSNTGHPSLRFKKVKKNTNIWEVSVTMNYRIVLLVHKNCGTLQRVGTHDIINKI